MFTIDANTLIHYHHSKGNVLGKWHACNLRTYLLRRTSPTIVSELFRLIEKNGHAMLDGHVFFHHKFEEVTNV